VSRPNIVYRGGGINAYVDRSALLVGGGILLIGDPRMRKARALFGHKKDMEKLELSIILIILLVTVQAQRDRCQVRVWGCL
jgi:hypothetical protein